MWGGYGGGFDRGPITSHKSLALGHSCSWLCGMHSLITGISLSLRILTKTILTEEDLSVY